MLHIVNEIRISYLQTKTLRRHCCPWEVWNSGSLRLQRHALIMSSMSPPRATTDRRCEGYNCPYEQTQCSGNYPQTFYCEICGNDLCDSCWTNTPPHRPGKQHSREVHVKVDRVVVDNYARTFERRSEPERSKLHRDDEETTWFGIVENNDEAAFEDYEQYNTLMSESLSTPHKTRYPKLVSFIGETGRHC